MLKIGEMAPSFCAANQDDVEICSRDLAKMDSLFLSKRFNSGCTTEACDFTDKHSFLMI